MRRKLKNLKNKGGHSDSAPRSLIDETQYREHGAAVKANVRDTASHSGWSHATRPRDQAIFVRRHGAATGASGPT